MTTHDLAAALAKQLEEEGITDEELERIIHDAKEEARKEIARRKQIHDNDTGAIFNVIEGGGHKIVVDILNKVSKDAEIKAKEVIADIPYFKNAYNVFALTPEENLEITRRITMTLDEAIKREKIGALRLEEDANQMKCAKESDATRDALLKIAEERMEIALYLEELKELRAQKVVHCKECRYADKYSHCALVKWWNKDDDYCSRGER